MQFPNAPLILAFASGLLAHHSHGREHSYAQAVSYLAIAPTGEVARADNTNAANAFQRYLLSPATQSRIRAFHNKTLGRPIFFAAGRNNEAALLLGNGAGSGPGSGTGTGNGHGKHG